MDLEKELRGAAGGGRRDSEDGARLPAAAVGGQVLCDMLLPRVIELERVANEEK